jgi:hypothetical protein
VSLILEALRKLEREKPDQARHTTVLLAPLAWPKATRSHWITVALGVTLLALLVAVAWFLLSGTRLPGPALAPSAALPQTTTPPTATAAPTPRTSSVAAHPIQARPLAKPTAQSATPRRDTTTGFRLTAIGDQAGVSVAVINDRLVRVGDALLGARIVRIAETEVELVNEADGRHFTIGF